MAIMEQAPTAVNHSPSSDSKQHGFALLALTSLFFMWGFITCLNDILIPHLKNVFSLSYTQAMLIQFCFFGAYFIVSVPAGRLVQKIGYQKGIVVGLAIAALGCALFIPSASFRAYALFLAALFVLASGVTLLQVSANPYVTALGKPESASSRLTMTQAFNALGTTVAPAVGGMLILTAASGELSLLDGANLEQIKQSEADAVKLPYAILAGSFLLLSTLFYFLRLPNITLSDESGKKRGISLLKIPHLKLGVVSIFLYVGAEVAIGSFLVNFIGLPNIAGLEEAQAANYVAYYWGGAMLGRFIGAWLMQSINAGKMLAFNSLGSIFCIFLAVLLDGHIAMWSILAVGLFNSIMFPTIFSLALNGLNEDSGQASGLLCLAIVGGAVVPLIQGVLADNIGLQFSLFLPALCYAFIFYYGIKGHCMTNTHRH